MNIGVYTGSHNPKTGGAYTFTEEIVRSLVEQRNRTDRRFTILTANEQAFRGIELPPNLSVVKFNEIKMSLRNRSTESRLAPCTVPPEWSLRGAVGSRLKRLVRRVSPYGTVRNQTPSVQDMINQAIVDNEISMMWSLTYEHPIVRIPYITTVWDLQHRLQPFFPEVSITGWTWEQREEHYTRLLRRAAAIVTGTSAGKGEIEFFYQIPASRIHVLPFPTPDFATAAAASPICPVMIGGQRIENYVFYPSQFWPHKNHICILSALRILRDEFGLRLSAVFVGSDKGNLTYVESLIDRWGLREQVHRLGFVDRDFLVQLYKNALALTFVSYFGPDNLPPLEAFALGCPVLASNVPGAREQLGDAAVLIDPTDFRAFAIEIRKLAVNKAARTELIARGTKRALQGKGQQYIEAISSIIDRLESIRACWGTSEFVEL